MNQIDRNLVRAEEERERKTLVVLQSLLIGATVFFAILCAGGYRDGETINAGLKALNLIKEQLASFQSEAYAQPGVIEIQKQEISQQLFDIGAISQTYHININQIVFDYLNNLEYISKSLRKGDMHDLTSEEISLISGLFTGKTDTFTLEVSSETKDNLQGLSMIAKRIESWIEFLAEKKVKLDIIVLVLFSATIGLISAQTLLMENKLAPKKLDDEEVNEFDYSYRLELVHELRDEVKKLMEQKASKDTELGADFEELEELFKDVGEWINETPYRLSKVIDGFQNLKEHLNSEES